jgi:hypothetical protein
MLGDVSYNELNLSEAETRAEVHRTLEGGRTLLKAISSSSSLNDQRSKSVLCYPQSRGLAEC